METLTAETLPAFLIARGHLPQGSIVRVRGLSGGVSNHVFWVDTPQGAWVVKQAREKLAVDQDWHADVQRVAREAEALRWWHKRLGSEAVPALLWLERDFCALGMSAIGGDAENYKQRLLAGRCNAQEAERFGTLLAALHACTTDEATHIRFANTSYFQQLRLDPYYATAAQRHPDLAPRFHTLRQDCLLHCACLVHGDYSPKNALVRDGQLFLLDYEAAHWGNPSFDLAFALTHFLAKALHLPAARPQLLRCAEAFWQGYTHANPLPQAFYQYLGWHLGAMLLARVDGKSPLEYLRAAEQEALRALGRVLIQGTLAPEAALQQARDFVGTF